jgi:hypothetical protein
MKLRTWVESAYSLKNVGTVSPLILPLVKDPAFPYNRRLLAAL